MIPCVVYQVSTFEAWFIVLWILFISAFLTYVIFDVMSYVIKRWF